MTSLGYNSYYKTHPIQAQYAKKVGQPERQFLHAEIAALIKAKKVDSIYVFRKGKSGFLMAKPCPICELAIREKGIKNVYFTV